MEEMKKKGNVIALLPIGVFLVLYLGLGILFEDVYKRQLQMRARHWRKQ